MKALGNHASTLGKESSMRKNSRGKLSAAVQDESASLAEVQRQEEEVSSRDKSAISPETDAASMRRWRTDSIIEEASPHDSPHFQTGPKVSAKTGSSASVVANRSTSGYSRGCGIVGHAVREQVRPQPDAGAQPSATSPDHPNETNDYGPLKKALGTMDPIFVEGLVRQLLGASARGDNKFDIGLSFTLAVLNGTTPKDELDAMHLAQMTANSMAIIRLFGELARTESVPHVESLTRAINQLTRTYTAQLEARKRYLTGGEQKLTVQNVSVNDGGQAIVTNVNQATGGAAPDELTNTTPALTDARQSPMDIIGEPQRAPAPLRRRQKA
jgi:hypothetical protein